MRRRRPPIIRHLVLWLTTACNLNCAYCYRGDPSKVLALDRDMVRRALSLAAAGGGPLHVQMAGGEPTLVPELMETVAREVHRLEVPTTLAVQTNGVALDHAMARLFKRWSIGVGVSLDGPPEVQERLRGRAPEVWQGLEELNRAEVDFGVTAVVCAENLIELPRLAMLLGHWTHARGLGLDLLVRRGRAMQGGPSMAEPEALIRAMQELAGAVAWISSQRRRPLVLREQKRLQNLLHPFCQAALGASLAVHPDGSLYPCGQTMGDEDCEMGTLDRPDFTRAAALAAYRLEQDDCASCPLEARCPGECPSRLKYNGPQGRVLACALLQGLTRAAGSPWHPPRLKEYRHAAA
ncbi:MAG: radical SAM protein [Deltaproteobacteria bacterium]|nr:radical SAM protein [Deltaproteobacteria bacterium]